MTWLMLACAPEPEPIDLSCTAGLLPECSADLMLRYGVDSRSFEGNPEALNWTLLGLREMVTVDAGPWPPEWRDDDEHYRWIHPPEEARFAFEEALTAAGPEEVRQIVDLGSAAFVREVLYDPHAGGGHIEGYYQPFSDTLAVVNPHAGGAATVPKVATLMFHEAMAHGLAGLDHDRECPDDDDPRDPGGCDSGWDGPYGVQLAWQSLVTQYCWEALDEEVGETVTSYDPDLRVEQVRFARCVEWTAYHRDDVVSVVP